MRITELTRRNALCHGIVLGFYLSAPLLVAGQGSREAPSRTQTAVRSLPESPAVSVATLVKAVRKPDEAYFVFENQRTFAGQAPGRLIVFPFATTSPPQDGQGLRISEAELLSLKEGRRYSIGYSIGTDQWLQKWRLLERESVATQQIQEMAEPIQQFYDYLKQDPWLLAGSDDPKKYGAATTFCLWLAGTRDLEGVLNSFSAARDISRGQIDLVDYILYLANEQKLQLAPAALRGTCEQAARESGSDRYAHRKRGQIMVSAMKLRGDTPDEAVDQLMLQWLRGNDVEYHAHAVWVLYNRKIAASIPHLWELLRTTDQEHRFAQYLNALAHQLGDGGPKSIIEFLISVRDRWPHSGAHLPTETYLHVNGNHIELLKVLDQSKDAEARSRVLEALICAGDPEVQQRITRAVAEARVRWPHPDYPRFEVLAKAWAPSIRTLMQQGQIAGNGLIPAVAILRQAKQPELADLLAKAATNDQSTTYALQYLHDICEARHRPLLEQFANNNDDFRVPQKGERRLYALAGLARLGDQVAKTRMIRAAYLSPASSVRFRANQDVLPTMNRAELLSTWEAARPDNTDEIELAVHAYIGEKLSDAK